MALAAVQIGRVALPGKRDRWAPRAKGGGGKLQQPGSNPMVVCSHATRPQPPNHPTNCTKSTQYTNQPPPPTTWTPPPVLENAGAEGTEPFQPPNHHQPPPLPDRNPELEGAGAEGAAVPAVLFATADASLGALSAQGGHFIGAGGWRRGPGGRGEAEGLPGYLPLCLPQLLPLPRSRFLCDPTRGEGKGGEGVWGSVLFATADASLGALSAQGGHFIGAAAMAIGVLGFMAGPHTVGAKGELRPDNRRSR
jgi:hypothetical protein